MSVESFYLIRLKLERSISACQNTLSDVSFIEPDEYTSSDELIRYSEYNRGRLDALKEIFEYIFGGASDV